MLNKIQPLIELDLSTIEKANTKIEDFKNNPELLKDAVNRVVFECTVSMIIIDEVNNLNLRDFYNSIIHKHGYADIQGKIKILEKIGRQDIIDIYKSL